MRRDHTIYLRSVYLPAIYDLWLSRPISLSQQQRALSLSTPPHHFAPSHTSYISPDTTLYISRHATTCVLILLYMCPHITKHVSCVLIPQTVTGGGDRRPPI